MQPCKWGAVIERVELSRQLFHLFNGTVILMAYSVWGRPVGWFILVLSALGLLISLVHVRVKPLPFADALLEVLERKDNMGFPGRGAIFYGFGVSFAMLFFCCASVKAALVALTYGDAFSTLVGKWLGKRPLLWNKRLTVEGSLGFVTATMLFGGLWMRWELALLAGVLGALLESVSFVDDNFTIPLGVGLVFWVLFCHG